MNPSSSPARKRPHGATVLALAAGLAFGHIVAAMAAQELAGPATVVAALVFVAAGSASTIFALVQMAADGDIAIDRSDVVRWVVAIGAGLIGALSPGLF